MAVSIRIGGKAVIIPFTRMFHQPRPDRVSVNISKTGQHMPVILYNGGSVAVSPEMPGQPICAVVVFRVRGLELTHKPGKIPSLAQTDDHMEVITHRHEFEHNRPIFTPRTFQDPAKSMMIWFGS